MPKSITNKVISNIKMKHSKILIVVLRNNKGCVATKQEMEEINYNFYNKFYKLNLRKPTKGQRIEVQGPSFFAKNNHCKDKYNLTNPISLNELQVVANPMAKGKSQHPNKVLVKFYTCL